MWLWMNEKFYQISNGCGIIERQTKNDMGLSAQL